MVGYGAAMTTDQTHGHEILDMVAAHPEGIALEDLGRLAGEKFGAAARYCTCSAEGMDFPALIAFLVGHDKVRIQSGIVYPGGSPACDHEH